MFSADRLEYDANNGRAKLTGAVEFASPALKVRGSSGEYSPALGAQFEGAQFELPASNARGAARNMQVDATGTVTLDESCVEAEELSLVLSTMSANSFNFVYPNTGTGTHTIQVQAKVTTSAYSEAGTANAYAVLGKGSTTVEQVHMTNSEIIF